MARPTLVVTPHRRAASAGGSQPIAIDIRITGLGGDTGGMDGATPQITVSVGVIGPPRETALGWTASYQRPKLKAPSVAILIARLETSRGPVFGAASIRLIGRAKISARTEPHATLHLRIAGETIGPLFADENGLASATLTVAPGETVVETDAVDQAGNRTVGSMPVSVPPFAHLLFAPVARSVAADGRHPFALALATVSRRGHLIPFDGECTTSAGTLQRGTDDHKVARWQLSVATTEPGTARISCAAPKSGIPMHHMDLELTAGPLHRLEISGPSECAAGESIGLLIQGSDFAGNRLTQLPELRASMASGSTKVGSEADGGTAYTYSAPRRLPKDRNIVLRVTARGTEATEVRASHRISMRSGAIATILVGDQRAAWDVVRGEELRLPLHALDSFGNVAPLPAPPQIETDACEASFHVVAPDQPSLRYRCPATIDEDSDQIRVISGNVRAVAQIHLHAGWEKTAVGGGGGVALLDGTRFAPVVEFSLVSALPLLDGAITVGLAALGAASPTSMRIKVGGTTVGRIHQTLWLASLLAVVGYRFELGTFVGLSIDVGGGLVLLGLDTGVDAPANVAPPTSDATSLSPAASARLAGDFMLPLGRAVVSVRGLVATSGTSGRLEGDVLGVVLTVGWRYAWPGSLW